MKTSELNVVDSLAPGMNFSAALEQFWLDATNDSHGYQ